MNSILDVIGPAIWRASWQAAILAVVIFLTLKVLGDRVTPRWRYLFWSVVLLRLLFVATPSSPLSGFNLVAGSHAVKSKVSEASHSDPAVIAGRNVIEPNRIQNEVVVEADSSLRTFENSDDSMRSDQSDSKPTSVPSTFRNVSRNWFKVPRLSTSGLRLLTSVWIVGCLFGIVRLIASRLALRRQLAVCRVVADPDVMTLLENLCPKMNVKRVPVLLVTPRPISPCVVGTWDPRIVVPESIVMEPSHQWLRHVLAHELAHIVRRDLWTNWLVLAVRVLHWFNPVAWWTILELHAEREAACDELALNVLGSDSRSLYAATIVDLASSMPPSVLVPGLIGIVSSARRIGRRVERLVHSSSLSPLSAPIAGAILVGIAVVGLTDSRSIAGTEQAAARSEKSGDEKKPATADVRPAEVTADSVRATIRGVCRDMVDGAQAPPMAGVTIRLFEVKGYTTPIREIANQVTAADGVFEFPDLVPPRRYEPLDKLSYLLFADKEDRPFAMSFGWSHMEWQLLGPRPRDKDIRVWQNSSTIVGNVVNSRGEPVSGATVAQVEIDGRAVPGILSAVTDDEGRFEIRRIQVLRNLRSALTIWHPDYPKTQISDIDIELPSNKTFMLPDGCIVIGKVVDQLAGKSTSGAVVFARGAENVAEFPAIPDRNGQFRMVLPEARYHFLVKHKSRTCVAITDRDCVAGETVELPPLELIEGGFVSGRVINAATRQPMSVTNEGQPISIGVYGPSQPRERAISQLIQTSVNDLGEFKMRVAPGDNFPYFVNMHGDRMAWDTEKVAAVVVKPGQITQYDMMITPKIPPEEKFRMAKDVVNRLPSDSRERTADILEEFRKLNHTVDETELWCMLMRELVAVGPAAVPQLCAELDATTNDRMLRRLGFALRAIGDPKAVPALIRAIPRTHLPSSSDYGLIVGDAELSAFMQKFDLDDNGRGTYFNFGRPIREIFGALHKLTGQAFEESDLFGMSASEVPGRSVLQRRHFLRVAGQWKEWWEAHYREFVSDENLKDVKLQSSDDLTTNVQKPIGPDSRVSKSDGTSGAVLSPPIQDGRHAWHFYDLDTGYQPKWPGSIPKDESQLKQDDLSAWTAKKGIDLMCVTHKDTDGNEVFVLRSFGLKVWEISPRDLRNLDKHLQTGKRPPGREVGELLMHYDTKSQSYQPDANAIFVYVTKEGNAGVIEVTDRVTRTQNLTGLAGDAPKGVGFHKGVRFNLKTIVP